METFNRNYVVKDYYDGSAADNTAGTDDLGERNLPFSITGSKCLRSLSAEPAPAGSLWMRSAPHSVLCLERIDSTNSVAATSGALPFLHLASPIFLSVHHEES